MTKARDIADGQSVDTSAFLTSGDLTDYLTDTSTLDPANLDDTGTIPSALLAGVGGGKVLQVVSAETTSTTTTTNANLQDTALALNITPSSADSKIFIQIMPNLLAQSSNSGEAGLGFGISREIDGANNTAVFETAQPYEGLFVSTGGASFNEVKCSPNVFHLDEPSTTGVCRYKFRIKAYNGITAKFSDDSAKSTMIAFEIAS